MADKDDVFGGFIDSLEEPGQPPKKGLLKKLFSKKKDSSLSRKKEDSSGSFYDESMDFLASDSSDKAYGEASAATSSEDTEEFVPTLKNLFGFKWWEFGVIIIEVLLIIYMILVLLKIVPLF